MIPFFDIHSAHAELSSTLQNAFQRVLQSGHLIMGSELQAFEQEFAAYCGAKYCIGVGNGLDALALTLRARGVGPGDEVLVPSQTFVATWLGVSMVGATPIPVEVDPVTYAIDPKKIKARLSAKTKAIIPVHLYGLPAAMEEINDLCKPLNIFVLEDAAQAHGATCHGVKTGALGDAAAFSFYPTKNLGALGDGGAVVTSNDDLANKVRMLRNYGSAKKYVHEMAGVNSRLDELQAALLRCKLPHLDQWNASRQALAGRYTEGLRGVGDIRVPEVPAGRTHVFHLYVISTAKRDALSSYLTERGVQTLVHYPTAPHSQGAYADLGYPPESLPLAVAASNETLSLPLWPQMTTRQVDEVVGLIRAFFKGIR